MDQSKSRGCLIAGRGVGEFFRKDHLVLSELFRKFQANKYSDYDRARKCFEEFKSRLENHMVWEEELLFPFFDDKTGMQYSGLTAVMRTEHARIREALLEIYSQTVNMNPHSESSELSLLAILNTHNDKEEATLYPVIDDDPVNGGGQ